MADDRRLSKFLSLVLRHDPDAGGVAMDGAGWASVEALLAAGQFKGTRADLERIVRESDKQRFALSEDGAYVRARQGHSRPVDLGLEARVPPDLLFHGTATRFLEAILAEGLKRMARQHVHLSPDPETATRVGQRHGRPVVLTIEAGRLHRAGQVFWLSENGVWLTGAVPPDALSVSA